jgi:hypothetical protein
VTVTVLYSPGVSGNTPRPTFANSAGSFASDVQVALPDTAAEFSSLFGVQVETVVRSPTVITDVGQYDDIDEDGDDGGAGGAPLGAIIGGVVGGVAFLVGVGSIIAWKKGAFAAKTATTTVGQSSSTSSSTSRSDPVSSYTSVAVVSAAADPEKVSMTSTSAEGKTEAPPPATTTKRVEEISTTEQKVTAQLGQVSYGAEISSQSDKHV